MVFSNDPQTSASTTGPLLNMTNNDCLNAHPSSLQHVNHQLQGPRGKETEAHKTWTISDEPSLFRIKTELIKEAKPTTGGIRALWGIWMTHDRPSKTSDRKQSHTLPYSYTAVCVCVWIPREHISVGMTVENKKMVDGSRPLLAV